MDSFLDTLKSLGPARLGVMLMTLFGLVVFFIFIAVRSSAPNMNLLYAGLSPADSTEIAAKLDLSGIPYQLSVDGTQVNVGSGDIAKARMLLAEEGLPRNATFGYELFDKKQSFGTTSFEQNINRLRAMEGELARTIGTIDSVRSARVHLVLPQRELFSRESRPASASVFLNLRNATSVGPEQIQAIQHLVAAAVPQLKSTNVAIIDGDGNLLARGEEGEGGKTSAQTGQSVRQNFENNMVRSIEDMLAKVVGYGKVRATVTADLNFDVLSRNSEIYDPDGQVVRSTQSITEENVDNTGANANAVTVQNNLPGLPGAGGAGGETVVGIENSRTEEVTNYEITKTVETLVRESGEVNRLSVAVLVDGRYEPDTTVQKPEDAGENWQPPMKYVPRSAEELKQIETLVKTAIGYDESRGDTVEVVNMQFTGVDFFNEPVNDDLIMGFEKQDLLGIAETLTLSIVAVLVILLVLRPLATHIATSAAGSGGGDGAATPQDELALLSAQGGGQQAQLAPPGAMPNTEGADGDNPNELEAMIDMSQVEGKVKASSIQKISELVTNHPNETVSVIRGWMSQENS